MPNKVGESASSQISLHPVDSQNDVVTVDDIDALQDPVDQGAQRVSTLQDYTTRRLDLLEQSRILDRCDYLTGSDLQDPTVLLAKGRRIRRRHAQDADQPIAELKADPKD
jgi:hypothetical protein